MEVIGSTASVFALYQLCASIKDIVDFGKAVQDAPTTVKALFKDLELLELVVAQARSVAHLLTFDDITEKVLRNCESKISILHHKLANPINRFQSGNFIQRKWSALKITLKVEDIKDLQRSIQDAKITLQISQTNALLTCFASVDSKQEQTLVEISSINHLIRSASKQDIFSAEEDMRIRTLQLPGQRDAEDCLLDEPLYALVQEVVKAPSFLQHQSSHLLQNDISWPRFAKRSVLRKQRFHSSRKLVLQTPLYRIYTETRTYSVTEETEISGPHNILDTQFECIAIPNAAGRYLGVSLSTVLSARSTTGWKYSFQSFRTVPDDSLIFEYCKEGNIGAIQSLFKRGLASPWDRDAKGRTPLWIAAESLQPEVAKLLLQEGADPTARDWDHKTEPISAIVLSKTFALEPRLNMIRVLLSHYSDYDDKTLLQMISRLILAYRPHKTLPLPISWGARREGVAQLLPLLLGDLHPRHDAVGELLYLSVKFLYEKEVLRWILGNMKGSIDGPKYYGGSYDTLYQAIAARLLERDYESMRCIMQRTGDLHLLSRVHGLVGGEMETPTSQAMNDMGIFLLWRKLLGEVGVDMKGFVRRELEVTEWGLRGKGWDEWSLGYLFTSPDVARGLYRYEGGKAFGGVFPLCGRCGDCGTRMGARLKVDLAWRRRLRDIRLRRFEMSKLTLEEVQSKGSINIFLEIGKDDIRRTERRVPVKLQEIITEEPALPYRIVCANSCQDGICVAWAFEGDGDELIFPAYLRELEVEEDGKNHFAKIEDENCPTKSMPGAFVE